MSERYGMSASDASVARTVVWRSEESLWRDAERKAPGKLRPKVQLARVVAPREAVLLLGEAKQIAPNDPAVASELGRAHLMAGDAPRAARSPRHAPICVVTSHGASPRARTSAASLP